MTIANTAAALAPMLTPMMSGLASGLRSVVWKIAPPTPNASPTSTPSTARGSLVSIRMYDAPGIVGAEQDPEEVGHGDREVAEQHPGGEARASSATDRPPTTSAAAPPGRRAAGPRRTARRRPGGAGVEHGQRGHHSAPIRPRRTSTRNTGTPTTAVMIADLHLGRRQHDPADGVGEHDQHGADPTLSGSTRR